MKDAIMIEPPDIKKLIAEKFGIEESKVVKMQYSYMILKEDIKEERK